MDAEIQAQIASIKASTDLPDPPIYCPLPPDLSGYNSTKDKLARIQRYIESFEYNYSGTPFVNLKKSKNLSHIYSTSKQIIHIGLPIQCVEATFLGCYLTADCREVERVPLSFKSKFLGKIYRHIVLAVRVDGKWGALGISRRSNLMNKPMKFDSLGDLAQEYKESYKVNHHRLLTVYVGEKFAHEKYSDTKVKWKTVKVRMNSGAHRALNEFSILHF
jgi:tubulinyl-Tyr carboxypeptidase